MSGYNFTSQMVNHDQYGYQMSNSYESGYYPSGLNHQDEGYNYYPQNTDLRWNEQSNVNYDASHIPWNQPTYPSWQNPQECGYTYYPHNSNSMWKEQPTLNQSAYDMNWNQPVYQPSCDQGTKFLNSSTYFEEMLQKNCEAIKQAFHTAGEESFRTAGEESFRESSQFLEEHNAWVREMQGINDELKRRLENMQQQSSEIPSSHVWYDNVDEDPIIDSTTPVDLGNHESFVEDQSVLENLEGKELELEPSHLEEIIIDEPLELPSVEVIIDMLVIKKEVNFPHDPYLVNLDVEVPNPVLMFLGRYFRKVPRAKAPMVLFAYAMDGSLTEYARKNHERKTIPFDNG